MKTIRTYSEIRRKAEKLYGNYKTEVLTKGYSENMGNKYIDQFDEYIGSIFDYDWSTRQGIKVISDRLFNCVTTPI